MAVNPVDVPNVPGGPEMLLDPCVGRTFRECEAEAQHCGGSGTDGWLVWLVCAPHLCAGRWVACFLPGLDATEP